jgi:hypothetical protein
MGAERPFENRSKWYREGSKPPLNPGDFADRPGTTFENVADLFQDDRDGPVVHELDLHPGAEDAGRDLDAEVAQRRAERLVQRLRPLRAGGRREARAVALRRVGEERELADDERRAAGLEERAVELAGVVLEDTELPDLRREPLGPRAVVITRDAEQDEQPRADLADGLAADADGRARDALDDRLQLSSSLMREL